MFKKKLASMFEVRKIITLMFAVLFFILAVTKAIPTEYVLSILTMVFGYYFGRSTALDKPEGDDK